MVSAARLRKAEQRARSGRPYAAKLRELIARVAATAAGFEHPLLERRDVERVLVVLITSDRGLAGPYNANLIRKAQQAIAELAGHEVTMLAIGRKGYDAFRRRGVNMLPPGPVLGDDIGFAEARDLARTLTSEFTSGRADRVVLVYSRFMSAVSQRPEAEILLPLDEILAGAGQEQAAEEQTADGRRYEYLFEPSVSRILGELLPRYVEMQVYRALVEAKASEHGARMSAMKNATDNAEELTAVLTLDLNRARQAAITKEIAEIVGGAEALKG